MGVANQWQKSSFSGAEGPNCVEVAATTDAVLIRENDDPDAVIAATPAELREVLRGVKADAFRHQ